MLRRAHPDYGEYRGAGGKPEKVVLPITYCRIGHDANGPERRA
jgi:hypothetical protein